MNGVLLIFLVFHKFFWNLRLMKEINTTGQNCHNIKYKCKCGYYYLQYKLLFIKIILKKIILKKL